MLGYFLYWVWNLGWRLLITSICFFTIQHILHQEYAILIKTKPLLIIMGCLILIVRLWSGRFKPQSIHLDPDRSGD